MFSIIVADKDDGRAFHTCGTAVLKLLSLKLVYIHSICDTDVRARDRERAGQEYGAVPFPAGEGCV